jgi:predicted dehydrogenase
MANPVGVGVIGCGAISGQYFEAGGRFPNLKFIACADLNPAAAAAAAAKYGVPRHGSVADLLAADDVELVLNLTVPKAHAPVSLAALEAGKHVYLEKPLGLNRQEGEKILETARRKGLLVGCAPDTFLGSGLQTSRRAIDDGRIGRPVAFTAFMMCPGHESWHPSPEFYYEVGGGPMFDMGPYYLTALLNLLGPVKRISGMASIAVPKRTITSQPKSGKTINVETPDHVAGLMEFAGGAVGTIVQSFATHHAPNGTIAIYGTDGTLHVPDPNHFSGPVRLRMKDQADWTELPPFFRHDYGRSVGLADMAGAIRDGRPFRASGAQAMAVLDLMQGFLESSADDRHYHPTAPYQRPVPLPANADFGIFQ